MLEIAEGPIQENEGGGEHVGGERNKDSLGVIHGPVGCWQVMPARQLQSSLQHSYCLGASSAVTKGQISSQLQNRITSCMQSATHASAHLKLQSMCAKDTAWAHGAISQYVGMIQQVTLRINC